MRSEAAIRTAGASAGGCDGVPNARRRNRPGAQTT
jgi:hypothetical protein